MNFVHSIITVFLGLISIVALPIYAEDLSPENELLLQKTILNIQKAKSLKASRVEKTITVRDGDEKFLGSVESIEVPVIKNGKEEWKGIFEKKIGDPGMRMSIVTTVDSSPGSVLDGYGNWMLKDNILVGGQLLSVWEGSKTEKNDKATVEVYIGSRMALPSRLVFILPIKAFGVTSFRLTVTYGTSPNNVCIPLSATSDIKSEFLFRKRHITVTKLFYDWADRPAL